MDLTITPAALKSFSDKDSKKPHFRELYEQHDFLTAYSKHTDLRVADNPKGAIGREDEWESHGVEQLQFLIHQGLRRESRLLDVGCGVGRFARKVVRYLDTGHYTGIDISPKALEHAQALAEAEGWIAKGPTFLLNGDLDLADTYDMLWAHSVFTHLPAQQIALMICNAAKRLTHGGKFLFTYKAATKAQRSGLKQFQYPPVFFATVAHQHNFACEPLPYIFPAHQSTMRLTRLPDELEDE